MKSVITIIGKNLSQKILPLETGETSLEIDGDIKAVTDNYHTIDELYSHRIVLFMALMKAHKDLSWKSKKHADGTNYEGWFIAGIHTPVGDISYYIPIKYWDVLDSIRTVETAEYTDGHSSIDVLRRISKWLHEL